MGKLFGAIVVAGALCAGQASAGCAHSEEQMAPTKGSMQRAVLVAAMSCGDVSLGTHTVFYRADEPQQTDAALLAFVLLLRAQRSEEPQKKVAQ
jgi:hypothetical protein